MRIAIDARAYNWTGIGRYTRNILREFARENVHHEFVILIPKGKRQHAQNMLQLPRSFVYHEVEPSYYSWREQVVFCMQAMAVDADLFHFTHFNVPLFFRKPYIMTVHDTTRFVFPGQKHQHLVQQIGYEVVFSQAVKRARAVVCVSDATRFDLENLPIQLPDVVTTIHEGVDEIFFQPISRENRQKVRLLLGVRSPYLLYVGVWMNHKNIVRLLEAYMQVRESFPHLKLVITGKPVPGYSRLMYYVRKAGLEQCVIFPGFVSHALLSALYAEAVCFVFPSLYEGFGLPPLEAAACGCPVVASHVSSIPEVMGWRAEYVNPECVDDIARGIEHVLRDRNMLVEKGKEQTKKFQWNKCAQKTLALYDAVA